MKKGAASFFFSLLGKKVLSKKGEKGKSEQMMNY
jgi:hypothetical protein